MGPGGLVIREARPEDKPFIEEIARLTWGGNDYLSRVFDDWLGNNFYVLDLDGKVVGTVKLTIFPCRIGWLEGLRVHPGYRGRGYGRLLHMFIVDIGERLAEEGVIDALEFATYFLNRASIGLAERTGFRVRSKFYDLSAMVEDFRVEEPRRDYLNPGDLALDLIPVGWHFVERCDEILKWLEEHARVYSVGGRKFIASRGGGSFTPLQSSLDYIEEILPAMAWVARSAGRERFSVMLPDSAGEVIPELRRLGLTLWDNAEEPNVIVFRRDLGH